MHHAVVRPFGRAFRCNIWEWKLLGTTYQVWWIWTEVVRLVFGSDQPTCHNFRRLYFWGACWHKLSENCETFWLQNNIAVHMLMGKSFTQCIGNSCDYIFIFGCAFTFAKTLFVWICNASNQMDLSFECQISQFGRLRTMTSGYFANNPSQKLVWFTLVTTVAAFVFVLLSR